MSPFYYLVLLSLLRLAWCQVFNLADLDWNLRSANGTISIPANIPSQAHVDLLRAGVITEPLLGINDFTQRWVANTTWIYTADLTSFTSKLPSLGKKGKVLLVFYGLDTVATITWGNSQVAFTNSQFRQYVFDVTAHATAPPNPKIPNNLTVTFQPAYDYALNIAKGPGGRILPGDNFVFPDARAWIRKIQSDFGWDWGPSFMPAGIYKPARLVVLRDPHETKPDAQSLFIEEKSIEIFKVGQVPGLPPNQNADWIVNVTLTLRTAMEIREPFMEIEFPELNLTSGPVSFKPVLAKEEATMVWGSFKVNKNVPDLWYPHNLGAPIRYNVTVKLPQWNSSFTTTTGFRTIVLVMEPYSQEEIDARGITPGDQYHFEINGKPFYSSGTNVIPFDPFYARTNTSQVRWVLESAKAGGQNMVRIWGGGAYQPSDEETGVYNFYEICDELGILAWSELIFSDALYPITDFFLENVVPEVQQNVRRTNRHPSQAQWAGGNENEGIAMRSGKDLLDEYVFLVQDFLHDLVYGETHSVTYTDCSTTNGIISRDPYKLRLGNMSYPEIYGNSERWNYSPYAAFHYNSYPVSRFVNEFGFHSMPSVYSWMEVLESPEDFLFKGKVVLSRTRHPPPGNLEWPNPSAQYGQEEMSAAVDMWLPPPNVADPLKNFTQMCWSTQVFQSMIMISEVAFYRRGAGLKENNLGALVWQLNDIWQGASWSAIEYSGRWKVTQYGLTHIFSPVFIHAFWTDSTEDLEITVVSDRWEEVNVTAQIAWFDWHGKQLSFERYYVTVPPLNNTILYNATDLINILPKGYKDTQVWARLNLVADTTTGQVTNEGYFTPASLANAELVDPAIELKGTEDLVFTMSAKGGVAAYAWIDHPEGVIGYFIDTITGVPTNGIYLVPGQDRTLKFYLHKELSRNTRPSADSFVVRSVWNNTHV